MYFKYIPPLFLVISLVLQSNTPHPLTTRSPTSQLSPAEQIKQLGPSQLFAPPFPGYFYGTPPENLYPEITEKEIQLYFKLVNPALKDLMETYINEVNPKWLTHFGYAPFAPLFLHLANRPTVPFYFRGRNHVRMPRFDLHKDFKKVAFLVEDVQDIKTLVRLENVSRDFFSEICSLLELLGLRRSIKSLKEFPLLIQLPNQFDEFTTNPILFRLAELYHTSGPWLAEQILTHGLITLGLNGWIESLDDVNKIIEQIKNSELFPLILRLCKVKMFKSIDSKLIKKMLKQYQTADIKTPQQEYLFLIQEINNTPSIEDKKTLLALLRNSDLTRFINAVDLENLMLKNQINSREIIYLLETLALRNPSLFNEKNITLIRSLYTDLSTRYLFYYLSQATPSIKAPKELFPLQNRIETLLLKAKNPRVLIINNIADGIGDHLIRNAVLMQALLDSNPNLEIDIYTSRGFLFSHPRIHTYPLGHLFLRDYLDLTDKKYDLIIENYDPRNCYIFSEGPSEYIRAVNTIKEEAEAKMYFQYHYAEGFVPKQIEIEGQTIPLPRRKVSVYDDVYRFCAELGLPFNFGTYSIVSKERSIFVAQEEYLVNKDFLNQTIHSRPTAILNINGGQSAEKGLTPDKLNTLKEMIKTLIDQGYFVLILPNGKNRANDLRLSNFYFLSQHFEKKYHRFLDIAPSPGQTPYLHKFLVHQSEMVITVEGGLMHLSYLMGKKMIILMMKASGNPNYWIPFSRSPDQIFLPVVTPNQFSKALERLGLPHSEPTIYPQSISEISL